MKAINFLQTVDITKPCYVLVSHDQKTLLMDPTTSQPWYTYSPALADKMRKIVQKENKTQTTVVLFIDALRMFAEREGVKLLPPFTATNVAEQLKAKFYKTI